MKLTVNGEPLDYGGAPFLAAFLLHQAVDTVRVAVTVNDEIVRQSDRPGKALREGDRVEILVFAGGG